MRTIAHAKPRREEKLPSIFCTLTQGKRTLPNIPSSACQRQGLTQKGHSPSRHLRQATTHRLGQGPRRGREAARAQPSVLYPDEHGGRLEIGGITHPQTSASFDLICGGDMAAKLDSPDCPVLKARARKPSFVQKADFGPFLAHCRRSSSLSLRSKADLDLVTIRPNIRTGIGK
jgi:hypothetical protein